jgi:hypothetical protein
MGRATKKLKITKTLAPKGIKDLANKISEKL